MAHLAAPRVLEPFSVNDIGSGATISKGIWFGRSLTTNELEDIEKRVRSIYLHGCIEYKDAFNKKRYTDFCLSYSGTFPHPKGMIFSFCEKGNKAN